MGVGQDGGLDVSLFFFQVHDVRNNVINAGRFVFRKLQTDVDDDDLVFVFQEHAVAADFFQSAEWHKSKNAILIFLMGVRFHLRTARRVRELSLGLRSTRRCRTVALVASRRVLRRTGPQFWRLYPWPFAWLYRFSFFDHFFLYFVGREGLEPSRPCGHSDLNATCLPVPPPAHN